MQIFNDVVFLIWMCLGLHLIADFIFQIQGMLHKFKCESWWEKQVKERIGVLNSLSQTIIDDICNIADNEKRIAMSKKFMEYNSNVYEAKNAISRHKSNFVAGLLCHSVMWAVVTFLPLMFVVNSRTFTVLIMTNVVIHALIDHLKCNKEMINLCVDQLIHLVQVVGTVYICFTFFH